MLILPPTPFAEFRPAPQDAMTRSSPLAPALDPTPAPELSAQPSLDPEYLEHVALLRDASLSGRRRLAPDGLWIAVTENCNFKCIGCWREGLFKKTYLSHDELRKMLASSTGQAYSYISFTNGEAFLHPQLCDLIEMAREYHPNAVIDLISNGSIPPKGRFAKAVAMVDDFGMSIDGATKETYESIRRGGNFEKFLDNVREVVAIRKAAGKPGGLSFSFTAITRNIGELPDVVKIAADLGVPYVWAQPMEMEHPDIAERTGQYHISHMPKEEMWAWVDKAKATGKALGVAVDVAHYLERPRRDEPQEPGADQLARDMQHCQYPYEKPFQFVRAGDKFQVLLCCYMFETTPAIAAERYGLEFDTLPDVIDTYNSEAFWKFRTDLAHGRAGDLCGRCMQASTYPWRKPK